MKEKYIKIFHVNACKQLFLSVIKYMMNNKGGITAVQNFGPVWYSKFTNYKHCYNCHWGLCTVIANTPSDSIGGPQILAETIGTQTHNQFNTLKTFGHIYSF